MTKISDLAQVISVSIKNPSECEFDKYVGLEHYDSGEPMITRYGSTELLTTNVKHFKAGDILLARRNVNLRRAGLVNFEGITSGDSIVLRPYNKEKGALLPFILNTTTFWDWAEANSDGTMSKRLSPKVLVDYEFDLPSLPEQKILADKLWAAYRLKESYKKLLAATDEMVKSQFIEMFGDPIQNSKGLPQMKVKDISSKVGSGATPSGGDSSYKNEGISLVRSLNVYNNKFLYKDLAHIDEEQAKKLDNVKLESKDILLNITGASVTRCCIVPDNILPARVNQHVCIIRIQNKKVLCPEFCNYMFTSDSYQSYLWILASAAGTTRQALTKNQVEQLNVIVPPMEDQLKFVAIAEQADKSKFELRKSIEAIDAVIKSLINENI